MKRKNVLIALAVFELLLMALAVVYDFFLPTLDIIALGIAFLLLRKEKFAKAGFRKEKKFLKMAGAVLLLTIGWTLVDFGLLLPILNHLTGTTQNMDTFENLKGNLNLLLMLLAASWTLAAVGEELAYRGLMQHRIRTLFKDNTAGIVAAVAVSSVLFGLAHSEQGIIGVVITMIDALFFSFVRYRFDNLWAAVLAHGFSNTIGVVTFFFTGPLYGLW